MLNQNGTNFSGGDRDLSIDDGFTTYSIVPAASLQALSNSRWGSVAVPPPPSASFNTLTQPSFNLSVRYANGTTDYTAGSVTITAIWEKVV